MLWPSNHPESHVPCSPQASFHPPSFCLRHLCSSFLSCLFTKKKKKKKLLLTISSDWAPGRCVCCQGDDSYLKQPDALRCNSHTLMYISTVTCVANTSDFAWDWVTSCLKTSVTWWRQGTILRSHFKRNYGPKIGGFTSLSPLLRRIWGTLRREEALFHQTLRRDSLDQNWLSQVSGQSHFIMAISQSRITQNLMLKPKMNLSYVRIWREDDKN